MLLNGLGDTLEHELSNARRFVDLFAGSAAVANHVAQTFNVPLLASDLQAYSVALANAVLTRKKELDGPTIWKSWLRSASKTLKRLRIPPTPSRLSKKSVSAQRDWCAKQIGMPITTAYGGHYFSARQAVLIDALRSTLPKGTNARRAALASLIQAASYCAASPGHTAQPFQPTPTARKYLHEAWKRNLLRQTKRNLITLSKMVALQKGSAKKIDANVVAKSLRKTDLVFIDPPYSGVHYSRFYHVLETLALGKSELVSGVGRYPSPKRRPHSQYSIQSGAQIAFENLMKVISSRGSRAIVTFPNHKCSNGLSGYAVQKIAAKHFRVKRKSVASKFSSLGGTSDARGNQAGRDARRETRELILVLTPHT
jgi:adenine-specific DNA methylase